LKPSKTCPWTAAVAENRDKLQASQDVYRKNPWSSHSAAVIRANEHPKLQKEATVSHSAGSEMAKKKLQMPKSWRSPVACTRSARTSLAPALALDRVPVAE